jgi:predicted  nucleic acid-binding Zn-ribbon protein
MKKKWRKEIVDELKLKTSRKIRELKGEEAELERYRDATMAWELGIEELRKEIEEVENRLKELR